MRSSFAILVLALLPLAGSFAQAAAPFDDGVFFRTSGDAPCRTKHGVVRSDSFCATGLKAADRPTVKGAGDFAGCVVETAVDMLDGDMSPIHFLASGKVMVEDRVPKVGVKTEGLYETYTIHTPADPKHHMSEMERDVMVRRDANHNIIEITSNAYLGKLNGPGIDRAAPIKWHATYSYPGMKRACQIDRIESDLLATNVSQKMIVQYDSELCASVLHITGQRKAADVMSRPDLVRQIQGTMQDRAVELINNERKGLQYDARKGDIPVLLQSCRNAGTPLGLLDLNLGPARKSGAKATGATTK